MIYPKLYIFGISLAAYSLCITGGVQAAIIINNGSYTVSTACSTSEVTLGGSNSNYCAGYYGNLANQNPGTQTTALNTVTDGADWSLIFRNDSGGDGSGIFSGLSLSMTGVASGVDSDTWTFSWQDTNGGLPENLPFFIDLAFSFKAGAGQSDAGIAFFLFDDFLLTDNPYSTTGTFDLIVDKGLSNNGLWARNGEGTPDNPEDPPPGVPEPTSLWLMGVGLIGFSLASRKKAKIV